MPFIFESFDLSGYDLVISIGSSWSKGVITRADTTHLNYCLTPTRFLHSHRELYLKRPQFGLLQRLATPIVKKIFSLLTNWDLVAATRPDYMISISELVKTRVQKYYNRDSTVIYPPVDLTKFSHPISPCTISLSPYYLTVSRLVPYKNIELLVRTFNKSGKRLVVVGTGSELSRLRRLARSNITFTGQITDEELAGYYSSCQAFLQANVEDFGISMVEALSAGKPVIAYREGGAGEIVKDQVTGILVKEQSVTAFLQALKLFETMQISPDLCRESVKKFGIVSWNKQIQKLIGENYAQQRKAN